MKKVLIIVISIVILIGGIVYWLIRNGRLEGIVPGSGRDRYEYKSEELKKMSEEAGINLEKGMVEEKKEYTNEIEEIISNKIDIVYRGKIIQNADNNKEWVVRVSIPEVEGVESKYGIWEGKGGAGKDIFISELNRGMNGEWEYRSKGDRELKGKYIIGVIGEGNTVEDIQYIIGS